MRILVLSKRQYTGKDLLDDCYGRLYEIPAAWAACGHQVMGLTLSYRTRRQGVYRWEGVPGLEWLSVNTWPFGVWLYPREIICHFRDFKPDIVWACSDAFHAILGQLLCARYKIPLVIDLYDNFESFSLTRLPSISPLFRAACRRADGLSLVSQALQAYVTTNYRISAPCIVIGNGVNKSLFFARDKSASREILGLPVEGRIIGTAGAISSSRGISDLFEAFLRLAAEDDGLFLAYAGPRDSTPERYPHRRIIDLGNLPLESIPLVVSALDVAVVCNRDSDFGRYCFPQKLFEILACGIPIVAAKLGDVAIIFARQPECLYPPGNVALLAGQIKRHLTQPTPIAVPAIPDWSEWAEKLDSFFAKILQSQSSKPVNGVSP